MLDEHRDVAVVLMDMMMPEMDGYEATRELRGEDPRSRLPIVALTAKAMPGDKEKALEAGCDDFVPKPVERDHLIAVLRRWIRNAREHEPRRALRSVRRSSASTSSSSTTGRAT